MLKKSKNVNNQVQTIKIDVTGLKTLSEQIVELVETVNMTDDEILAKYKYVIWRDLNCILTKYFEKRFHLVVNTCSIMGIHIGCTFYSLGEPIGKALQESIQKKRLY